MNKQAEAGQSADHHLESSTKDEGTTRRELLQAAGRFAAYTPPVLTMLLAPSDDAFARSGGGGSDSGGSGGSGGGGWSGGGGGSGSGGSGSGGSGSGGSGSGSGGSKKRRR